MIVQVAASTLTDDVHHFWRRFGLMALVDDRQITFEALGESPRRHPRPDTTIRSSISAFREIVEQDRRGVDVLSTDTEETRI